MIERDETRQDDTKCGIYIGDSQQREANVTEPQHALLNISFQMADLSLAMGMKETSTKTPWTISLPNLKTIPQRQIQ